MRIGRELHWKSRYIFNLSYFLQLNINKIPKVSNKYRIPPKWTDFSVWFGLSVCSAHNFGRIFYTLVEKLIENAVKHLNFAIFYNLISIRLYENVARSLTFLTKLLVVSYDKLKKLHEYFSRPPSSSYGNSLQGQFSSHKHGATNAFTNRGRYASVTGSIRGIA